MKKIEIMAVAILLAIGLMAKENSSKTSPVGTVKTDEKTGVVQVAYNVNDTGSYKGNSEEIALQYLTNHAVEFLKGETAALKHLKTIKSPAGTHVGYIQTVNGIPVIGAITTVNLSNENKVTFVANHYRPGIKVSTSPKITAVQAIGIARQSFAETGFKTCVENKTELSVFVTDNQIPILVWKVNMLPDFGGDWYFLIDALTGEIIKKENIAINVNGSGKVFVPDPGSYFQDATLTDNNDANYFANQSVYQARTLPGLNSPVSGYYYLRGEYAYSMDIGTPYDAVVSNTSSTFNYTRNQNGFEEANCYYHLDNTLRFVRSLGFAPEWNNQTATATDIVFDARGELERNAHYYPSAGYITYGVPSDNVDAGEDQSVIVHELGHALHDVLIIGGIAYGSTDCKGISEGISDYLAIDYRRQLSGYRPNARCNWFYPTASNTISPISEVEFYSWWVGRSIYEQMQTWASSLMDLEYNNALDPSQGYRLGRDVVTKLQLTSLSYVTADDDRFDNVLAMYQADIDIYNGEHLPDLIEVYHNRLLFTGAENQVMNTNIAANTTWSGYKMVDGNRSVNAGVTLTLAPSSILVLNGDLTISAGANLVIGDNVKIYGFDKKINIVGNLVCNTGSQVITDANTVLYYNGGTITLNAGSSLTLNGTLSVATNKTATISGSGYICLNGSISATPGSSLTINGSSKTVKMLEVQKSITLPANLTNVTLQNGKIIMANSNAELFFNSGIGNVNINNVIVTTPANTYNAHQGFDIRCPNFEVKNSVFEYGLYGLYIVRPMVGAEKNITGCTFNNNTNGLLIANGAYKISGCNFNGNTQKSIVAQSTYGGITCKNTTIIGGTNAYAIDLSNTYGRASFYNCNIRNAQYGINANNAVISFKCS